MDLFGIGPIADLVKEILAFFPTAEERDKMATKLQDLAAQIAAAQSATNTAEAQSGNLFIAGWRPAVGWLCVCGLFYSIIQVPLHLPATDTSTLTSILYAMLGLGTMRTAEKLGGVATKAIKKFIK